MNYDVVVIGGGPAGATAGSLLKKYRPDLKVAIFERERFPRDHVGESQLPALCRLLDEVGVWDKVEAAGFPIKIGGTYRWGATDDLWHLDFIPRKDFVDEARPAKFKGQRRLTAFQVDRSIYDKILLDHAREQGCEVFEETPITRVVSEDDCIQSLEAGGQTVQARTYIDASGEAGILRRALNLTVDCPTALRNIAIWDYWHDAEWAVTIGNGGTRIQVMSLGWGWIWFIPITETRTSVGLVVPADYYKSSGKSRDDLYRDALMAEPLISELLKNARPEGNIQATKDWNFVAERLVGKNWFLTGDSAGFADPILSAGMTLAQSGARKAAYTILEIERGTENVDWLKQAYSDGQRAQIRHHMQFADYWYSANGKFTDLKEYCIEIAEKAGLTLDADEAFRWLGTGGFAVEDPGAPRALSYGLSGLKHVTKMIGGSAPTWEINKTNLWRINRSDLVQDKVPVYEDGRVQVINALRRGNRILPISGVTSYVLHALERSMDAVTVVQEASQLIAATGVPIARAMHLVGETIEAMMAEEWIRGRVVPNRPMIDFRQ